MSDHAGAALMLDALPSAGALISDTGYDSDGFRQAPDGRGIEPRVPLRRGRKQRIAHDRTLHRIETMLSKSRTGAASPRSMTAALTPSVTCLAAAILPWIDESPSSALQPCSASAVQAPGDHAAALGGARA